jgi:glycosyltransferase involved in cell wall biosynthesis
MAYNIGILFCVLCGLIMAVQCFYQIFFFYKFIRFKVADVSYNDGENNPISVIVCARDEYKNLIHGMPALAAQNHNNFELLLVDDVSFDETRDYMDNFIKENAHVNYLRIQQEGFMPNGKKYPLSLGIKTSKHNYLALTDADCLPASPNWLQFIADQYNKGKEVILGYGPYIKTKGFLNACIRYETLLTALQYFSYALAGIPYMGVGRNLAYKKDLFYAQKGFAAHLHIPSGDDDLFIKDAATKHNTGIMLHPNSFMYSHASKTFAGWVKQKTRHYSTGRLYNKNLKMFLGAFSLSWFLLYPLIIACLLSPFYIFGLSVLLLRIILHGIIMYFTTKILKENDLFKWFWLQDIGMFFYYLIFAFTLIKKPKKIWK